MVRNLSRVFNNFKILEAFRAYEDPSHVLLWPKALFAAIQFVTIGIAMYKCSTIGLLPTQLDYAVSLPVHRVFRKIELTFQRILSDLTAQLCCEVNNNISCI